jgi:hypothetical protein
MTTVMKVGHETWHVRADPSHRFLDLHTSRFPFVPEVGLLSAVVQSVLKATVEALTLYSPGNCLEELSKATIDSI